VKSIGCTLDNTVDIDGVIIDGDFEEESLLVESVSE
jgi:hypothetical protein